MAIRLKFVGAGDGVLPPRFASYVSYDDEPDERPKRTARRKSDTDDDGKRGGKRPKRPGVGRGEMLLRVLLLVLGVGALVFASIFAYYYYKYESVVNQRMQEPLFANTAKIYAAPREVRIGQRFTPAEIAIDLRRAGYSDDSNPTHSPLGTYSLSGSAISIHPGPESYHAPDGATITESGGLVTQIAGDNGQALSAYALEPQLITGLSSGEERSKRRIVTYDELPTNLVQAVLAIEDRRFFEHGGVNYYRLAEAAVADIVSHRKEQGGSTLTMQLSRGFFLSPAKRWKRKFIEVIIAFQLEHRFSKKQIFAMYANYVPLGQRGSFAIDGFGEAAHAYFGKDLRQLDLAECALLAGLIQRPSYLSPYKHPERALERRNLVLDGMVETGAITRGEAERAKAEPLRLSPNSVDAGEAPYFVDLVRDQLTQKYGDRDISTEGLRIYTSLDPDLQRLATQAVEDGMREVDQIVLHQHGKNAGDIVYPQAALIALNPHTGQVLALVGGRNYGLSQLNHAMAKRPTGSIFKPFVYATAYNESLSGQPLGDTGQVFTATTMLTDEQATYSVGNQTYTPRNFEGKYHGEVTARYALQYSLNNATIELGSLVGFGNVAALARSAGIKSAQGTPAVSIGAYSATPIEMAGAYTVFANNGQHINPFMIASVRSGNGDVIDDFSPEIRDVLDPRVAYLTTMLMQNVINAGTGFEVRRRGFEAPAAGKTGTSHDAWFAGFTSNLICIVWVGNDDYSDVKIEGAKAAAPIWAEFMKQAVALPQYSDVKQFVPPAGVQNVLLDKTTNLLADETCPDDYTVAFLDGTAPTKTCEQGEVDQNGFQQRMAGPPGAVPVLPQVVMPSVNMRSPETAAPPAPPQSTQKPHKNFLQRLFGGSGSTSSQPAPAPQPSPDQ